jgi:hypothetical protein
MGPPSTSPARVVLRRTELRARVSCVCKRTDGEMKCRCSGRYVSPTSRIAGPLSSSSRSHWRYGRAFWDSLSNQWDACGQAQRGHSSRCGTLGHSMAPVSIPGPGPNNMSGPCSMVPGYDKTLLLVALGDELDLVHLRQHVAGFFGTSAPLRARLNWTSV